MTVIALALFVLIVLLELAKYKRRRSYRARRRKVQELEDRAILEALRRSPERSSFTVDVSTPYSPDEISDILYRWRQEIYRRDRPQA